MQSRRASSRGEGRGDTPSAAGEAGSGQATSQLATAHRAVAELCGVPAGWCSRGVARLLLPRRCRSRHHTRRPDRNCSAGAPAALAHWLGCEAAVRLREELLPAALAQPQLHWGGVGVWLRLSGAAARLISGVWWCCCVSQLHNVMYRHAGVSVRDGQRRQRTSRQHKRMSPSCHQPSINEQQVGEQPSTHDVWGGLQAQSPSCGRCGGGSRQNAAAGWRHALTPSSRS